MKFIKNIITVFGLYSRMVDGVSSVLTFISPTKNNWTSLAKPTEDCPIYAYRERLDGGFNQIPIRDLPIVNQQEISEKLDDEFGNVK